MREAEAGGGGGGGGAGEAAATEGAERAVEEVAEDVDEDGDVDEYEYEYEDEDEDEYEDVDEYEYEDGVAHRYSEGVNAALVDELVNHLVAEPLVQHMAELMGRDVFNAVVGGELEEEGGLFTGAFSHPLLNPFFGGHEYGDEYYDEENEYQEEVSSYYSEEPDSEEEQVAAVEQAVIQLCYDVKSRDLERVRASLAAVQALGPGNLTVPPPGIASSDLSPVEMAACVGSTEILRVLLDEGHAAPNPEALVDTRQSPPDARLAVLGRDLSVDSVVLPRSAALFAAVRGHAEAFELLLDRGWLGDARAYFEPFVREALGHPLPDPLSHEPEARLFSALSFGASVKDEAVALLAKKFPNARQPGDGLTPLMATATYTRNAAEQIATMRVLLDAGADINARCFVGSSALAYAVDRNSSPDVIEFLVSRGACPNVACPGGRSVLVAAIGLEDPTLIEALLFGPPNFVRAADLDWRPFPGRPRPLEAAVEKTIAAHPDTSLVEALLFHGANPNAAPASGTPILHQAQGGNARLVKRGGNVRLVKVLLAAGARVDAEDNHGRTALATELLEAPEPRPSMMQALVEAGANYSLVPARLRDETSMAYRTWKSLEQPRLNALCDALDTRLADRDAADLCAAYLVGGVLEPPPRVLGPLSRFTLSPAAFGGGGGRGSKGRRRRSSLGRLAAAARPEPGCAGMPRWALGVAEGQARAASSLARQLRLVKLSASSSALRD